MFSFIAGCLLLCRVAFLISLSIYFIYLDQQILGIAPPTSQWYAQQPNIISPQYIINTHLHCDCCCMLQFNCIMDGVSENWTSIVINVEENDDRLNHFGDGFGGNDHTLLIRGDMLFIYTVDAPYNNRLYPLRAVVGDGHGCFVSTLFDLS